MPGLALAGLAVLAEHALELAELVGLVAEVAEALVAGGVAAFQLGLHVGAVEAVEGVALDRDGLHASRRKIWSKVP
jgi:hypothetical protein